MIIKTLFLLGFQNVWASGENAVDLAAKRVLEKPVNKMMAVPYYDFKELTNMYTKKL